MPCVCINKNGLSATGTNGDSGAVAQNKDASMGFRTQKALKERFESAFGKQAEFSTPTAFFEDCMRALIHHARRGEKIAVPVMLLLKTDDTDQK